ncbi:hypothetical protein AAC387_Pa11g1949 [Persea americana]
MERKDDLPPTTRKSTVSTLSSSSPPPDFLRHVQAAFKRQRPLSMAPSNALRARRVLVPQSESSKNVVGPVPSAKGSDGGKRCLEELRNSVVPGRGSKAEVLEQRKSNVDEEAMTSPEDSALTPPSITETMSTTCGENIDSIGLRREECGHGGSLPNTSPNSGLDRRNDGLLPNDTMNGGLDCKNDQVVSSSHSVIQADSMEEVKVQFSHAAYVSSACPDAPSKKCVNSLSDKAQRPNSDNQEQKQRGLLPSETADMSMRSAATHLSAKTSTLVHDQNSMSFHGKDVVHPMTRSSVGGNSCATTTSVHSLSAPMPTSVSYNPLLNRDSCSHMEMDPLNEFELNPKPVIQGASALSSSHSFQCSNAVSVRQTATSIQVSSSAPKTLPRSQDNSQSKGQGSNTKEASTLEHGVADPSKAASSDEKSTKGKGVVGDATDMQSQAPVTKTASSIANSELSQSRKMEKGVGDRGTSVPRKKNYDPDVFFKVNGKLYQKLGKIGSGGSSEVHKVISSDCSIYALKKIKLKGRDYSTAYGFCQEMEYLNKLKGKKNIIQLIDYEVTDKTLLADVMNGFMNTKDGRIKDDAYIYMVLEYGEIDLAQMLSQKWKGMDSSSWEIDENWLRFYWQQILHAVYTIHEERIVHSDLKPANFLLVKGSLKLIDFGIAKAIMSDTTNIQRDAQVGTLNYMAPEAFMWNEHDENGNIIKCGRPSDIWSLGCILYQMVYGRTPFAEYKTFWAKFKVITDRNHEIKYDPVSNPWLLDLMKKCLAWERTDRWRIPQLLQHPFLVPPIPSQLPSSREEQCKLLMQMSESYRNVPEASRLCSELQQLISNVADSSM